MEKLKIVGKGGETYVGKTDKKNDTKKSHAEIKMQIAEKLKHVIGLMEKHEITDFKVQTKNRTMDEFDVYLKTSFKIKKK